MTTRASTLFRAPSPRRAQLLLALLLLFFAGWDLWAVLRDQTYSGSDTYLWGMAEVREVLGGRWHWPQAFQEAKGPVAPVLGALLLLLVNDLLLAGRLLAVLCHLLLVWQAFDLGRLLARRAVARGEPGRQEAAGGAGLWAALICGASPLLFGWGRLAFHDVLVAVWLMGSLQGMLRIDLRRLVPALLLGLWLGLGLMTKLSYVIYMTAPGLWFLASRLRGRVQVRNLGVLLGAMVLSCIWWAAPLWRILVETYPQMATQQADGLEVTLERARAYLALPGLAPLLAAMVPATAGLLWRVPRLRGPLTPVWGSAALAFLVHIVGLDYWSRYLVPLVPPAAVVVGLGLGLGLARLGAAPRRVLAAVLLLALLGGFVQQNLAGRRDPMDRGGDPGLLSADPRPHLGLLQVAQKALGAKTPYLVAHDSNAALAAREGLSTLWARRGALSPNDIDPEGAQRLLAAGRPVTVILVRRFPERPIPRPEEFDYDPGAHPFAGAMAWLVRHLAPDQKPLARAQDPDGMVYEAYRVRP